ncbi:similar to transcription factor FIGa (predicted) [Rattus norvegicus]|uniref:Similar to transcription factor FIGa (Predicted) n=1 Tax=Rattus norvegicus TaxID=10116 RepID=A6IAU9_RAT|nr:similar to transcription factor FIGa (predicted) [Rattus norvegicus]
MVAIVSCTAIIRAQYLRLGVTSFTRSLIKDSF